MKTKELLVSEIIRFLGNDVIDVKGLREDYVINNLSDIASANSMTLDWVNPTNAKKGQLAIQNTPAKTILVGEGVEYTDTIKKQGKCLIIVNNPKYSIAKIGNYYFKQKVTPGIHPTAIVSSEANIGKNVYIGPYSVIGKASIGDNSYISPYVKVYDDVIIGRDCVIKEGAIIGGDGFGFELDEEGHPFRFPQLGGVRIGSYVEIGANSCVDCGAFTDTEIGDYTKVDNQCHIAHNNKIGRNCIITSGTQIAGSNKIGDNVWIGPNSTIKEWCGVESDSFVGIGTVVIRKVKTGTRVFGVPADKIEF